MGFAFRTVINRAAILSTILIFSNFANAASVPSLPIFQIRDQRTPCAFYLLHRENTTSGLRVTEDLSFDQLTNYFLSQPDIDPAKHFLYAVGTSMNESKRQIFLATLKARLAAAGFDNLNVDDGRRLADFLADQEGVFVKHADGTMEKLSGLDPQKISDGQFLDDDSFVVVGTPVFGKMNTRIEKKLRAVAGDDITIERISRVAAYRNKILTNPAGALAHMAYAARMQLPMREDWQKWSTAELSNMGQKVVMPAILTFSVMFFGQKEPLQVLIPVTTVNATNSAGTATFRTFMGNWFRRSKSFFPSQSFKSLLLNVFFTADLYLASRGSWSALGAAFTTAGMLNFISTKWLTILFQNLWRTPLSAAVYNWEKERNSEDGSLAANLLTRRAASSIEKYSSWIVTQFFIYSITTKSSLLNVFSDGHGMHTTFAALNTLGKNQNLLMSFNGGHVMMALTGVLAFTGLFKPTLIGWAGRRAIALDDWFARRWQGIKAKKPWFVPQKRQLPPVDAQFPEP